MKTVNKEKSIALVNSEIESIEKEIKDISVKFCQTQSDVERESYLQNRLSRLYSVRGCLK